MFRLVFFLLIIAVTISNLCYSLPRLFFLIIFYPPSFSRLIIISARTAENPKLFQECLAVGCDGIYLEKPGKLDWIGWMDFVVTFSFCSFARNFMKVILLLLFRAILLWRIGMFLCVDTILCGRCTLRSTIGNHAGSGTTGTGTRVYGI